MSRWIETTGQLQYFPGPPLKCWLLLDPGIAQLYRWFIPVEHRKPKYPAHISVVRKIEPPDLSAWGRYEGEEVPFRYERWLYNDERYWWLNCHSERLEEIRLELGLPSYGLTTLSPDNRHLFHTTVANTKPAA